LEAFRKYGVFKGFWLTVKRLAVAIHGVDMDMIPFHKKATTVK
jgi:putative component of membrane protein insertase Oxa1/YidC/SpoIIIJ protein YidD